MTPGLCAAASDNGSIDVHMPTELIAIDAKADKEEVVDLVLHRWRIQLATPMQIGEVVPCGFQEPLAYKSMRNLAINRRMSAAVFLG